MANSIQILDADGNKVSPIVDYSTIIGFQTIIDNLEKTFADKMLALDDAYKLKLNDYTDTIDKLISEKVEKAIAELSGSDGVLTKHESLVNNLKAEVADLKSTNSQSNIQKVVHTYITTDETVKNILQDPVNSITSSLSTLGIDIEKTSAEDFENSIRNNLGFSKLDAEGDEEITTITSALTRIGLYDTENKIPLSVSSKFDADIDTKMLSLEKSVGLADDDGNLINIDTALNTRYSNLKDYVKDTVKPELTSSLTSSLTASLSESITSDITTSLDNTLITAGIKNSSREIIDFSAKVNNTLKTAGLVDSDDNVVNVTSWMTSSAASMKAEVTSDFLTSITNLTTSISALSNQTNALSANVDNKMTKEEFTANLTEYATKAELPTLVFGDSEATWATEKQKLTLDIDTNIATAKAEVISRIPGPSAIYEVATSDSTINCSTAWDITAIENANNGNCSGSSFIATRSGNLDSGSDEEDSDDDSSEKN